MVHVIISSLLLAAIVAIAVPALVLEVRKIVAYVKGDEFKYNRLRNYWECEALAFRDFGVDPKLFRKYWEEAKKQKGISAVPWDAYELAEWEYDIINNK